MYPYFIFTVQVTQISRKGDPSTDLNDFLQFRKDHLLRADHSWGNNIPAELSTHVNGLHSAASEHTRTITS